MSYERLQTLADSYPAQEKPELENLATQYRTRQEQEILEIAAIAADVSVDSILNLGLEPEDDSQVWRAFSSQYPNVDRESLRGASEERLQGIANGIKGKLFELEVVERLNSGKSVGELALGPGQVARLADSPTQKDWDVEIANTDGSIAEQLQLKASDSLSYIKRALVAHPGIRIAVPSEVDATADNLLGTDISHGSIKKRVDAQVNEAGEGPIENALDQAAEVAFDSIPIVSAGFVVAIEGRRVLMGRQSIEEAMQRAARRIGKATLLNTLGATLVASGAGVISVPTSVAVRIAWDRSANRIAIGDFLESKTSEILASTHSSPATNGPDSEPE